MGKTKTAKQTQEEIIFHSVPAMIFYKDTENRILRANKAAAESAGFSVDEIEGKSAYDLYPEGAKKYHEDDLAVIRSAKPKLGIVETIITSAGETRWVRTDKIPYKNENGKIIGVIVFAVDITDQKMAEELLAKQKEELTRSNRDLEQFAYVASHDLKEPLRSVSNYLQLLETKYAGNIDASGDHMIRRAVAGAKRMHALIDDLLQYARVGSSEIGSAKIAAETVLEEALENLKPFVQELNARVTFDPLPKIVYARTELLQIFQNLIGNAIKFHGKEVSSVKISAKPDGNGWIFSVQDNGIGIEKEFFEKIFLIFNRLHGRAKYQGNGVGLAICKKIVESRGGRIWVESKPGHGATFFFTIPGMA